MSGDWSSDVCSSDILKKLRKCIIMLLSFKKEDGKLGEILGRKAIGPVKWQPVALDVNNRVSTGVFFLQKN